MEPELLNTFASLGGTGMLAFAMWQIARRFIEAHADQVKITHEVLNKRVDALEIATRECEQDRRNLNEKLYQFAGKH